MDFVEKLLANGKYEDRGYVTLCLIWQGYKDKRGRGTTRFGNKNVLVHRLIFELINGETDLLICHKCDITSCFEPTHLFKGTSRDNMIDCVSKGRHPKAAQTHCKRGHEYNEKNTYYRHVNGRTKRQCRVCTRLYSY